MRELAEKQRFNQWWVQLINLGLLAMLLYFWYNWWVLGVGVDKVGPDDVGGQLLVSLLLIASFGIIYIFQLHTKINDHGIHYRFFPFHTRFKSIPWKDMEKCYTRTYRPLTEYGGWGYKFGVSGGKAFNIKGNQGIQIQFKNGKKLLIGTQRPKDMQAVINRYFKKKNNEGI